MTTAIMVAFAKFVAALGSVVLAYRNWRKEEDKAKKEKENKEES